MATQKVNQHCSGSTVQTVNSVTLTGVSVVIVTGVSVVIVTGVSVVDAEQFRTVSGISILVKSCLALLHQMVNQPMSQTVLSCSTGIRRTMSSSK